MLDRLRKVPGWVFVIQERHVQGEQHEYAVLSAVRRLQPMLLVVDWENREQSERKDGWLEKLIRVQNDREKYLLIVRDPNDPPDELLHRGWERWRPTGRHRTSE